MIVQGVDSAKIARPLLVDANGNVLVSSASLTTTGGKFRVDANGDVYVTAADLTSTGGKLAVDASGNLKTDLMHTMPYDGTAQRVKVSKTFTNNLRQNVTIVAFDSAAWYFIRRLTINAIDWPSGNWAIPSLVTGGVNYPCAVKWTVVVSEYYTWDINLWVTGAIDFVMDCYPGTNTKSFECWAHYDKINL